MKHIILKNFIICSAYNVFFFSLNLFTAGIDSLQFLLGPPICLGLHLIYLLSKTIVNYRREDRSSKSYLLSMAVTLVTFYIIREVSFNIDNEMHKEKMVPAAVSFPGDRILLVPVR